MLSRRTYAHIRGYQQIGQTTKVGWVKPAYAQVNFDTFANTLCYYVMNFMTVLSASVPTKLNWLGRADVIRPNESICSAA